MLLRTHRTLGAGPLVAVILRGHEHRPDEGNRALHRVRAGTKPDCSLWTALRTMESSEEGFSFERYRTNRS